MSSVFMGNTRIKMLAGAVAFAVVSMGSVAHAATTLVGGGATLPAIGYVGDVSHKQTDPAATGSLFAVFSSITGNPAVSYCQTGSGAGKNILAGVSGTSVQNACPDTGTITGFGAATALRTDLVQPNFAAADSPLASTDYSNYIANHTTSKPVQFPAVAGAVAIGFNKTDDQGTRLSSVNLSDAQICSVFSGQVTSWGDSTLASAFSLPSGHTISGAISVAFRSDGSGTTFAFSNHLSNVCSGTASKHFVTDQTFTNVVALFGAVPSTWVGASGNAAVAAAIGNTSATNGTIGYVEAANAVAASISFAKVNGRDPLADLGDPTTHKLQIASTDVVFNQVISGADPTTGAAVLAAISPVPTTSCVALVKPSSYATPAPSSPGYPIVAVSYLLGNSNGNGRQDTAPTQRLLSAPYNTAITGSASLTKIGAGTGLVFLNAPSITAAQITACVVN
jgi:phosphate transport system substrate-binding protein